MTFVVTPPSSLSKFSSFSLSVKFGKTDLGRSTQLCFCVYLAIQLCVLWFVSLWCLFQNAQEAYHIILVLCETWDNTISVSLEECCDLLVNSLQWLVLYSVLSSDATDCQNITTTLKYIYIFFQNVCFNVLTSIFSWTPGQDSEEERGTESSWRDTAMGNRGSSELSVKQRLK